MKILSVLLWAVVHMEVKSSLGNEREQDTERKRITVETEGKGRVTSLAVSPRWALDLWDEDFMQQTPGSRCVSDSWRLCLPDRCHS